MQQQAITRNPRVEQLLASSETLVSLGRTEQAVENLREALKIEPRNVALMQLLARWSSAVHEYDEPIRLLREAVRLRPKAWSLHFDLSATLSKHGRIEEAISSYRRAHQCNPPIASPLVEVARLLEHSGKTEEMEKTLSAALARWPNDPYARTMLASLHITRKEYTEAEKILRKVLQDGVQEAVLHAFAWSRLGIALDKQDRVAEAWEAYTNGKRVRIAQETPNRQTILEGIRVNREGLTKEIVRAWKSRETGSGQRFSMLAGFTRSGTTLLEVILGSHPDVATIEEKFFLHESNWDVRRAAGEMQPVVACMQRMSEQDRAGVINRYLARCRQILATRKDAPLIIDKHPMRTHLSAFFLWMFPDARIIIPLRDPRDVLVSNYTQDMTHPDLLSVDRIVDYYEATMSFWLEMREWLGDSAIEVRYEDTVTDLEREARRILDHLGLEWDPALLAFHERAKTAYVGTPSYQAVTQPVNTRAVGRWRRYEAQLRPVLDRLEPFVEAFGYEAS